MADMMYNELAVEQLCRNVFGIDANIRHVILWRVPVSRTDVATVFLTSKKQLYVHIEAQSKLLLTDVKKIVSATGLVAENYVPPKGRPDYFDEVGRKKFSEVFPGRTNVSAQDITFYRTLAPYSPALIQISEVKTGVIRQYDADSSGSWRPAVKFAYRRIKTS